MDSQVRRAALFLLLAAGPLAEVLSQNVPLTTFLSPVPFLLVSASYGVPVLLIRELAVAHKLDDVGIALLGLAYGILNEGVLAKTLTQPGGPPLGEFAGFGQVAALQVGWAIFIVFWHALHSVLYPIVLSRWLFPAAADRRWFASGWARWLHYALLIVLAGLYSLYFLNPVRSEVDVFIIYIVATAALVAVALRCRKFRRAPPASHPAKTSLTPALLGGCMLFFYLFQFWAPSHIPFAAYLAVSLVVIGALTAAMRRARWRPPSDLLLFGIGDYLTFAIFSSALYVVTGRNPWQAAIAGAIFVTLFLYLVGAVRRKPFGRLIRA